VAGAKINRAELDAIELMLEGPPHPARRDPPPGGLPGLHAELLALQEELVQYLLTRKDSLSGR
jgi:hypothetical protein